MKNIITIILVLLLFSNNGFSQNEDINYKNKQQVWVKDSTFFYKYNNDNWEFYEIKKVLSRNDYGQEIISTSKVFNSNTLNWDNKEQTSVTYNNSKIEKYISKAWNSNIGNWEDTILFREYDVDNNIVKYFSRNYDYDLNIFTGGYQMFNTYENNLKIEQIDYLWNKFEVNWKLFGKKDYSYVNDVLTEVISYNINSNEWKKASIKTYSSSIISFKTWNENYLNWEDSIGYKCNSQYYSFIEELEDFSKKTTDYDTNNNITKELFQVTNDQYNEWINAYQTVYSYNEDNIITEKLFQTWEANSDSWKNISKEVYYWSEIEVANVNNIHNYSIKIFPNPALDKIYFESNDFNLNNKVIQIFSITGKFIKHALIYKNEININDLPMGMYFIKIRNENKYITKKIVKE